MITDRLDQLRALLREDPEDRFLRYAIALELKRAGDMTAAAGNLETLIRSDPKYIACYYQLAVILAEMGRTDDAIHTCEAGSLQCLTTGDTKARAELLALKEALTGDE